MNIQIIDNFNYLTIQLDDSVLLLNKAHIRSIEAVKDDTLKIDTCQQPLNQLYIRFTDVTTPKGLGDVNDLRDAVANMVNGSKTSGDTALLAALSSLDRKLDDINTNVVNSCAIENRSLTQLSDSLDYIKILLDGAYNGYKEPLRIDEVLPGLTYKGYVSIVSGAPSDPVWAIQRIKKSGTLTITAWANGNKNFTNVWDARTMLNYIP